MPAEALRIEGYRELLRAFARADKTLNRELRDALREAADPVRADAESLASSEIRNIGERWSRMRVGVTTRAVYVAPRERGVGTRANAPRRRPNLAGLLMDEAMQPALDANQDGVVRQVEHVLDTVGRDWERR